MNKIAQDEAEMFREPTQWGSKNYGSAKPEEVVQKVKNYIYCANHPSIRRMAKKHGVQSDMIQEIIKKDLDAELRNELKFHALSHKQAFNA
jgi:hypothetical protein